MMLDELIERLWELKRAYGEQEVKLLTQKDAWSWDEHDIDGTGVYFSEDDRAVVIEGKDKTKSKE